MRVVSVVYVLFLGFGFPGQSWAEDNPSSFSMDLMKGKNATDQKRMPNVRLSQSQLVSGEDTTTVHVTGAVEAPGAYRFTGSPRVSEAIQLAGGLQSGGSKREIQVLREKAPPVVIDLFRYLVGGQLSANPYLKNDDVVFVPLSVGSVSVLGAVRRPGTYEWLPGLTLGAVIEDLGGGYAVDHDSASRLFMYRTEATERRKIELDEMKLRETTVIAGDTIIVPSTQQRGKKIDYEAIGMPGTQQYIPESEANIFVVGGVARPGPYPYVANMDFDRYIALAGGTTLRGKPQATYVQTWDGRKIDRRDVVALNPGDAVVVPQKKFSDEFWPTFFLSMASVTLSGYAILSR